MSLENDSNIWIVVSGALATVITALGVKEWFPAALNYFRDNKTAKRKEVNDLRDRLDKMEEDLNEARTTLTKLTSMLPLMRRMVKDNPANIELLLDEMHRILTPADGNENID